MDRQFDSAWFSLKGKTAVVTGGTGLLGKPFCKGLAEFGANVAVVDLDEQLCTSFAQELQEAYGIKAVGIGCDVAVPQMVSAMVEKTVAALGRIDILHNNAAGQSSDPDAFFAPFEDYTLAQWRNIMSVNIDGMFLVAQAVGKQMVHRGAGGSIIQTSSIYGAMAPDQRIYEGSLYNGRPINTPAVYSVSKAGVIGLTRYLATYWADKGIRVNCISPGGVESGQNAQFQTRYSARIPLGRMAHPNEMVGTLIYLASDASSYVTGQNFLVDGGLSAW
ncbi:MAG: SDR family oxidoreductase [Betaproteobacteria bacterium]|nr:SDR family oxidoreductase [Betaproteobacteria bacterium]